MKTQIQGLSSEVSDALYKYNTAIDGALQAAQKLEAISITAHLAEMFGCSTEKTAQLVREDYLTVA